MVGHRRPPHRGIDIGNDLDRGPGNIRQQFHQHIHNPFHNPFPNMFGLRGGGGGMGYGGGGPPYLGGYDHRGGYDNQRINRANFRAQEARRYGYEPDYDGLGDAFDGLDLGGYGGGGRGYGGYGGYCPPAPRRHGFGGFVRPRRPGGFFVGGWAFGRSARLPIAQVPRRGFGYGGRRYEDDFDDGYDSESDYDDEEFDEYEDRRVGFFGRRGFGGRDLFGRRRPRW